jgi:signal transduction histidine kinase/CheY-like chemotaxis protein
MDRVLDRLLEQVSRVVPNDVANVMLIEDDHVRITRWHGYDRFGIEAVATAAYPVADIPNLRQMVETGQPVVVADTQADPHWVRRSEVSWRSYVGAPICVQGRVVGFLNVSSAAPGFFGRKHAERLRVFADQVAIALQNARLFSSLAQEKQRLELLYRLGRQLLESLDVHRVTQRALDEICAVVGAIQGVALVRQPDPADDSDLLQLMAISGYDSESVESVNERIKLRVGEGLAGWVAAHRQTVVVDEVLRDPRWLVVAGLDDGIRSALSVPLLSGDNLVGVVGIYSDREAFFNQDHVHLVESAAATVAVAIANAQLFEQAQKEIVERKQVEAILAQERTLLAQRVEERTSELSVANAELARSARLKDEFLASMSHELRTPLNAILGMSEALLEQVYGELNEKQSKSLRSVEESGRHLLALINDILDLSKIGAGKMELDLGPVPVESACQSSLRIIKESAQKKQLKVSCSFDGAVTLIRADGRRLKQILVNLLNNSVKFTPEGGMIGLEVRGDAEHQMVRLTVWDTGIGISPQDLGRLFQPFVQLDGSLSRQYAGTGLGLALVYRMVEMHGGSVTVESEVGKGSRFTVSLPWREDEGKANVWRPVKSAEQPSQEMGREPRLAPCAPIASLGTTPLGTTRNHARQADGGPVTVLLAEDSETNINTVSEYLTIKGYQVVVARNGAEAIERARETRPAVIVMDIQMPGMDGLEATRRVRADADLNKIPIIAMTALTMPGDRERCLEAGANEYVGKPISLKDLVRMIEEQCANQFGGAMP